MKRITTFRAGVLLVSALMAFGGLAPNAGAELSREQVKDLVVRVERATDEFKKTIADKLGRAKGDESKLKDKINKQVSKLETATDKLRRQVSGDQKGLFKALGLRSDIKRVVEEAGGVDKLIRVGK